MAIERHSFIIGGATITSQTIVVVIFFTHASLCNGLGHPITIEGPIHFLVELVRVVVRTAISALSQPWRRINKSSVVVLGGSVGLTAVLANRSLSSSMKTLSERVTHAWGLLHIGGHWFFIHGRLTFH